MIGSSENRISYNGNGIATEFAYTFKILEKSDIKVLHVAADGTETLLTKDYYVDRDKSVVLYPGYAPGEEIPEQNRPPILSEGEMLVLYREVPITQESALDKHWPFNVIENGLDKLTIICQQIWDRLQRSFYVSESTSSNFDPKVPIEAGKTFRVKDDGTGFEVTEDPARVLLLAQDVYEQTKEQAEFAKEQAGASIKSAVNAQNAASAAKHYSENVNVFLPSVSDSGVLSWTNKAGLANPASVNIKGAKGDTGDKGNKGDKGDKGNKGDKGDTGTAATITVGRVTTGAAGGGAIVVNRGDANNAILDFVLPRGATGDTGGKGDKGDKGDAGTAATITVGTVTTGAAGSSASVVNRGDANNAILDFILPKGADGKGAVITVNGKEPDAAGNVNVDNTAYSAGTGLSLESNKFANTAPVYFVTGTQTAATNLWTGDLPSGVTEYTNGLTINYYLPYAGKSTAATLNLGGLGAKKIYQGNNSSAVSTQFPAGSVIQLVYIASLDKNTGAWKAIAYYYKDTVDTTGARDTNSKIFLIGATSQSAYPKTYSHDTAYVGTDGCLYSNNTKVSVEGHTHSDYVSTSDVANSANKIPRYNADGHLVLPDGSEFLDCVGDIMAELAKKLHFLKNGIEQTATIYTTTSEAGSNYITVKVDGTTGYVALGDIGHVNATIGMVNKTGTTYTILYSKLPSLIRTIPTALSVSRHSLAAASVGNYALFGGGRNSNLEPVDTVDAYNASLTRTTATALSSSRYFLAAASVGDYALFGGGNNGNPVDTVDAYNASLTRTTATALSSSRYFFAATSVGDYALFGGGRNSNLLNTVDAYNASLTRTIPTALSVARQNLAATSVGDYALFGGGRNSNLLNTVDAYNASLTRTTATALSSSRYFLAAASVGDYALFGGGLSGSYRNTVDAYDTSLTRTTPTPLSQGRHNFAATSVGDYALFGGGNNGNPVDTVDAYDTSLTRTIPTALSSSRHALAATTVGNYALFGGGSNGSPVDTVDAYNIS